MNNLKIKTYSLRKSSAAIGGGLPSPQGTMPIYSDRMRDTKNIKEFKDFKNSAIHKNNEKERNSSQIAKEISKNPKDNSNSQLPNSLVNEVNKYIKSPALNISSKLDSKGNRSININFFDKHVINSLDTKNSKDSKLFDQDNPDKRDNDKEKEIYKSEKQDKKEKNINIKLNINSEVINNNIKIRDSNDMSSLNGMSTGINCINGIKSGSNQFGQVSQPIQFGQSISSKENLLSSNKLKAAVMYFKDLTVEKDKRIDQLNLEISQLKDIINLYENNNQVINRNIQSARAPMMIHTPKSINQNSFISNSGFNLDLSSRLKHDKEKNSQVEINSDRGKTNGLNGLNGLGLQTFTPFSSQIFSNSKSNKLHSTSSSFLIKHNQVGNSIKSTKSFFGSNSQLLNKANNMKSSYFGVSSKNSDRKNNSFSPIKNSPSSQPIEKVLYTTIGKLDSMKAKIKDSGKVNLHTLTTELYATTNLNNIGESPSPSPSPSLDTKLNLLKSKTAKILNFYYEISINKNN